jgi:hypothetical protein
MSNKDKKSSIGLKLEERPGRSFDLLHVMLPVPRLFCLPKEARRHLRAARRERLLALRERVDAAIERLEEAERPPRKAKRVEVE